MLFFRFPAHSLFTREKHDSIAIYQRVGSLATGVRTVEGTTVSDCAWVSWITTLLGIMCIGICVPDENHKTSLCCDSSPLRLLNYKNYLSGLLKQGWAYSWRVVHSLWQSQIRSISIKFPSYFCRRRGNHLFVPATQNRKKSHRSCID